MTDKEKIKELEKRIEKLEGKFQNMITYPAITLESRIDPIKLTLPIHMFNA